MKHEIVCNECIVAVAWNQVVRLKLHRAQSYKSLCGLSKTFSKMEKIFLTSFPRPLYLPLDSRTGKESTTMRIAGVLLVVVMLLAAGCSTHNQTNLADTTSQITSPNSLARMDPDGTLQGSYPGIGGSLTSQDSEGTWTIQPGHIGVWTYEPSTGRAFAASPQNMTMKDVKFTPAPAAGEPALSIGEMTINVSEVVTSETASVIATLQAIQGMTATEAEARIRQMEAAGEITSTVAQAAIELLPLVLGL